MDQTTGSYATIDFMVKLATTHKCAARALGASEAHAVLRFAFLSEALPVQQTPPLYSPNPQTPNSQTPNPKPPGVSPAMTA